MRYVLCGGTDRNAMTTSQRHLASKWRRSTEIINSQRQKDVRNLQDKEHGNLEHTIRTDMPLLALDVLGMDAS